MLCSFRSSRSRSACASGALIASANAASASGTSLGGVFGRSARRSTTATFGSFATPARSGSVSSSYFPLFAFDQLSRLGVALPRTTTAPSARARTIATSRA
jgi:hypothetical protein